jgi:hypothetical protein
MSNYTPYRSPQRPDYSQGQLSFGPYTSSSPAHRQSNNFPPHINPSSSSFPSPQLGEDFEEPKYKPREYDKKIRKEYKYGKQIEKQREKLGKLEDVLVELKEEINSLKSMFDEQYQIVNRVISKTEEEIRVLRGEVRETVWGGRM